MIKRAFFGVIAALGLGGVFGITKGALSSPNRVSEIKASLNHSPQAAANIPAELGGSGRVLYLRDGRTPYQWGISRACFRMVRKNKKIARTCN